MVFDKIHFMASDVPKAQNLLKQWTDSYGQAPLSKADVVVALGGDGFMLSVLEKIRDKALKKPIYGVNMGHVGFLMNKKPSHDSDLKKKLSQSVSSCCYPLCIRGQKDNGEVFYRWAFNDVWLQRSNVQAAHLKFRFSDGFSSEIRGDGLLISTALGSTAYYANCGGLPFYFDSKCLGVTTICSRPEIHHILNENTRFVLKTLETRKRPVFLVADGRKVSRVVKAEVWQDKENPVVILCDRKSSIGRRLLGRALERIKS